VHVDDALCCIWRGSARGQSTLTVVDRSYANFRECPKGEVRRTYLPRTPVNRFLLNAPNVCRWHHAHSVDPI
jgi:hypothetical protein